MSESASPDKNCGSIKAEFDAWWATQGVTSDSLRFSAWNGWLESRRRCLAASAVSHERHSSEPPHLIADEIRDIAAALEESDADAWRSRIVMLRDIANDICAQSTASGVQQADALPAVHQGQETKAPGLSVPSTTPQKPHGYLWFNKHMEQRFTHNLPHPQSSEQPIGEAVPVYLASTP